VNEDYYVGRVTSCNLREGAIFRGTCYRLLWGRKISRMGEILSDAGGEGQWLGLKARR